MADVMKEPYVDSLLEAYRALAKAKFFSRDHATKMIITNIMNDIHKELESWI